MRRKLFLYLALVCFIGIIAIFIADGYMGIYDTIYVTAGEQEQRIGPDYWLQRYPPPPGAAKPAYWMSADWGQKVFFRYEIDNRRFSTYSTLVQASVWEENEKVLDLFSEGKSIEPFDKAMSEWTLSTQELGISVDGRGQYTVKIQRGEVEQRIVVDLRYPKEIEPLPSPPVR
ncbi:MAG: hypothetical protein OEZ00_07090 [Dehalococcoidia bacterium]|nr:hypothetical protein [Dehalococcoidia bacterium]